MYLPTLATHAVCSRPRAQCCPVGTDGRERRLRLTLHTAPPAPPTQPAARAIHTRPHTHTRTYMYNTYTPANTTAHMRPVQLPSHTPLRRRGSLLGAAQRFPGPGPPGLFYPRRKQASRRLPTRRRPPALHAGRPDRPPLAASHCHCHYHPRRVIGGRWRSAYTTGGSGKQRPPSRGSGGAH